MPAIKKYICINECFFRGVKYKPNDVKIHEFPEKVEVPHHFVEIGDKSSAALHKAVMKYREELKMLEKEKNPHKSVLLRISRVQSQIAALKRFGYVPPEVESPKQNPTLKPTPDPTPEPTPKQAVPTQAPVPDPPKQEPTPDPIPDQDKGNGEDGK